ncbi:MAG: OB-fold domain-containing protein [Actinobacteria bacterium]|nr:OB-fold domain-containing protein [Actinomycetota bacterium]MBU1942114.1 OB-fold domain-containing protein [Actinomycetota bacterium]MBU2686702.1 OB-fold domain-containing protein [Actinomycetota bacterium]
MKTSDATHDRRPLEPPELVYLKGETRCHYTWSTGEVVGSFLGALRDHARILGAVCSGCGRVAVPPLSYCEECCSAMEDYREVGPRGVVMSWTRVAAGFPDAPLPAPFRYVLVKLAGADTSLLHLAPDDERVVVGATLHPEFRKVRRGAITDIKWFVPDESAEERTREQ